jgi:hypothetical protein
MWGWEYIHLHGWGACTQEMWAKLLFTPKMCCPHTRESPATRARDRVDCKGAHACRVPLAFRTWIANWLLSLPTVLLVTGRGGPPSTWSTAASSSCSISTLCMGRPSVSRASATTASTAHNHVHVAMERFLRAGGELTAATPPMMSAEVWPGPRRQHDVPVDEVT